MDEHLLHIEDLVAEIEGKPVVQDFSLGLRRGTICAVVGHNGAGKSVTLKTILGLLKKKAGTIRLNGFDSEADREAYKRQLSYIPEEPLLFTELTAYQHFQLYGTSYGVSQDDFEQRVSFYTQLFELEEKIHEYPSDLSKGMRQKVNIISALLVNSPLLIVDEPFIGLDVQAAERLEVELRKRAAEGHTVLLTSHVIERVRTLCDSFVLLKQGRIVQTGRANELESFEVSKR